MGEVSGVLDGVPKGGLAADGRDLSLFTERLWSGMWLHWESACLASMKPWVQSPALLKTRLGAGPSGARL